MDGFIRDLWQTMQAMPEYAGKTTFIITTDHGRGSGLKDWTDHGKDVEGAENIWIAVLGPGIPGLGERRDVPLVTQAQIAASVAAAVGENWAKASGAAPALPVFRGAIAPLDQPAPPALEFTLDGRIPHRGNP